jgi:hypothetical protein
MGLYRRVGAATKRQRRKLTHLAFWFVDFFLINFSKKTMTQNLDDFIYVVILPNFWQTLAQPTDHLKKWPTHLRKALFILYTLHIISFGFNFLKIKFFDIAFHIFFLQAVFLNDTSFWRIFYNDSYVLWDTLYISLIMCVYTARSSRYQKLQTPVQQCYDS